MELVKVSAPDVDHFVIAPIGDIQWSGEYGSTAVSHLKRHIEHALAFEHVCFIGMGDYTDFASPSNRSSLQGAKIYDTARAVLEAASDTLVSEVCSLLKGTEGKWIGLHEGHHFYEYRGMTSDMIVAERLRTRLLGTSSYIHFKGADVTVWAHHGCGGGILPTAGLNKLYHTSAGLVGADVYMMGHSTKLGVSRLSRPFPRWDRGEPDLSHRDILLVNTGGFSRSNVPGSRAGAIPRGDYAEQGMMTPAPLTAPFIHVYPKRKHREDRVRVEL